MWLLLLAASASAEPLDTWEAYRARTLRGLGADQVLGAPAQTWDAWRWAGGEAGALDPLRERIAPEIRALDSDELVWTARPAFRIAEGTLSPVHAEGDLEPGLLAPRAAVDAWAGLGPFEARLRPEIGLDLAPGAQPWALAEWRLGARGEHLFAQIGQETRWFGPGRHGALIQGDAALPLPGLGVGADGRIGAAGRFSAQAWTGLLPGERRDVAWPGWLVIDARWLPVPWFEIGATRNALFGGWQDGALRPIDPLQVLLPTDPHVDDDPDRLEPDTDERAALDARVLLPLGRFGLPLDWLEIYVQHGGEDVIARRAGSIPVPSLAGSANLYGLELAAGPWYAGAEGAVVEDDLFRWYVGHRVYNDGWTVNGRSVGHPRGGDQRSYVLRAGRVTPEGLSVEATFEHVRRVQVADLVQDTVFVFQGIEVRDVGSLRVSRMLPRGGLLSLTVDAGPVRDAGFVPGVDRLEHRIALAWQYGWLSLPGASGP